MTGDDQRASWRRASFEYRNRKRGGPPRELKPCGTVAAARRHERAGEPLCGPCRAALRAYQADGQARRRAQRRVE